MVFWISEKPGSKISLQILRLLRKSSPFLCSLQRWSISYPLEQVLRQRFYFCIPLPTLLNNSFLIGVLKPLPPTDFRRERIHTPSIGYCAYNGSKPSKETTQRSWQTNNWRIQVLAVCRAPVNMTWEEGWKTKKGAHSEKFISFKCCGLQSLNTEALSTISPTKGRAGW